MNGMGGLSGLPGGMPTQVQVSPIKTILNGCSVDVEANPQGGRSIVLTHPLGQQFVVPLNAEGARTLGRALSSALDLPKS